MRQIVNSQTLADWCGISTRHVAQLAAEGVLVKVSRGRFDLKQSVTKYMARLREQAAGRSDIAAAAVTLKQANARLADLRYRKEARELIEVDLVKRTEGPIMRALMQRFLSLPGKFAFEIPAITVHDRARMEQVCRDEFTDASRGYGFDFSGIPGMENWEKTHGRDHEDEAP
jgi:phage terminase Nu1 subunit (DNA packaging protein)